MIEAEIQITESTHHPWHVRVILGMRWDWYVHVPGHGGDSGDARTEARARRRAEKAARKLAGLAPEPEYAYRYPVGDCPNCGTTNTEEAT